ncbi:hypothetical protein ABPG75_009606 [Micractinium tetrahymenae]
MLAHWEAPATETSLRGATLVLPVVSVGNAGQLAVDLLINTLQMPRVARLQDDALLQAVGARPYPHVQGLASAFELYQQQPGGVAVAQQRAPAAPGTQVAFAERLAAFVKQTGVKEVLVLGSIEATMRRDEQLAGPQLRCWAPGTPAQAADGSSSEAGSSGVDAVDAASAALLERCRSGAGAPLLEASFWQDRPLEARCLPPWPLLRALRSAGVPAAALLCFSSEGDNVADGLMVASAAAAAAGLQAGTAPAGDAAESPPLRLLPPPGWQYLYGSTAAVY